MPEVIPRSAFVITLSVWKALLLREAARILSEKARVVALSIDRGGVEQVQPFLERLQIRELITYVDPRARVWQALTIKALPLTVLIDPLGREVGRIEGAVEWDAPEALALVRSYMARSP